MWLREQARMSPRPLSDDEIKKWLDELSQIVERRENDTDFVVNGRIEFPTPFVNEHSGNIRTQYVLFEMDSADVNGPAVQVFHNMGVIPRVWWPLPISAAGGATTFLEQLLSSDFPSPVVAGHTSADVDGADQTKIIGGVAVLDGWIGNGVVPGDEILISGDSEFRRILSTTTGTPDFVNLTTPTDVPLGTLGLSYVIRKERTIASIWVRVVSGTPGFVVATLGFS